MINVSGLMECTGSYCDAAESWTLIGQKVVLISFLEQQCRFILLRSFRYITVSIATAIHFERPETERLFIAAVT